MQGRALPLNYMQQLRPFADANGIGLHLDGARLFNAAVATGTELRTLAQPFTSVSICLSKGLGAPAGSVLLGAAPFIVEARRWRKVTGGGMRQAGILAAAGLYALEHNVRRLADDHYRAGLIAEGLAAQGYAVEPPQTNMIYVDCGMMNAERVGQTLRHHGVRVNVSRRLRLVTHLDITDDDVEKILQAFGECREAV